MSHPLPGSGTRAGYVERKQAGWDYLRLLVAPPRDEDVLVHDEIVYYKAPKHVMSLGEPFVETVAVFIVVIAALVRPSLTSIDAGVLVLVLSAIVVIRWVREREWGWGSVVALVLFGYFYLQTNVDPVVVVTAIGVGFLIRFGLCALRWYSFELRYLTNRRIIEATGFLGLRVASMPVARVTDLVLTRSTTGEIFGFGDLRIESAGDDQSLANIRFLTHPKHFHRLAVRLATKPAKIDLKTFIDVSSDRRLPK